MSADSSATIRIMSVDDHPVLRQGIDALVAGQSDMSLVAEASNGREAIQQFRAHHPDVTLMDLQMPEMNGLDALIAIRGEFPAARIMCCPPMPATFRCCGRSKPARGVTC